MEERTTPPPGTGRSASSRRWTWARPPSSTQDGAIHTLTIVGQIEGHQEAPQGAKTTKYEHVLPLLTAVEESDEVDGLLHPAQHHGGRHRGGAGHRRADRRHA